MSGKKIKKDKRAKELKESKWQSYTLTDSHGQERTFTKYMRHENEGLYRKNNVKKRHVENPNIYEGEEPMKCALRNIRVPSKKRKTAMKRFKKAFPHIKVDKNNVPHLK